MNGAQIFVGPGVLSAPPTYSNAFPAEPLGVVKKIEQLPDGGMVATVECGRFAPLDLGRDATDLGLSNPTGPAKFTADPRKATIVEGRAFVLAQRARGAECPCCGQYARAWRRPLLSVSVADLIRLVRLQRAAPAKGRAGDFFHVTEFSKQRNGNFALLALWGLIVEEENGNKRKRKSGRWRATGDGCAFVDGDLTVPRYLITFDRRLLAYSPERVNVRKALKNRFDYAALMRGDV